MHWLKSGMDPENNLRRLAGTTTGGQSQLTGEFVPAQVQRLQGSALAKVRDPL